MKRTLILVVALIGAIALLALAMADVIPPRSLTASRMQRLKSRVLEFARQHGKLPKSLSELPVKDGYDNSVRDGWRRGILFEASTSSIVTFRSLGRDGLVGGVGEDADITRSFVARDERGQWSDSTVGWLQDTFRRQ